MHAGSVIILIHALTMVLSDCLDEEEYFTVCSDQKNKDHQIIGPHNKPIGQDNLPQLENIVSSCLDMQ